MHTPVSVPKSLVLALAVAALSTGTYAYAADSSDPAQQPAPIVRAYPGQDTANPNSPMNPPMARAIISSHPILGVAVRSTVPIETVSADAKGTEIRIAHGIANVSVHHPGKNTRILVDLPGGQTALLKDGLYTFNADSNIAGVLKGEADAYPGAAVAAVRIKEDHQFAFGAASSTAKNNRAVESSREEQMADYLPPNNGDGPRSGYGARPYGDGFYAYPPYGYYGYPYGFYGYPYGLGLGFGYYGGFGGFRGGGFRGRFR